jgi:hypothetical protein
MNIVAGDALTIAPAASLIAAVIRPSHLLGVTRRTTKVRIYALTAYGNASNALRVCLPLRIVEIRREPAQLRMRSKHNPAKRKREGDEEAEQKERAVFHDACASISILPDGC